MKTTPERKEHGQTVGKVYPFVPADLIAKMAGVQLNQVIAILAAQNAIKASGLASAEELTDFRNAPMTYADRTRAIMTEQAYTYITGQGVPSLVAPFIKGGTHSIYMQKQSRRAAQC